MFIVKIIVYLKEELEKLKIMSLMCKTIYSEDFLLNSQLRN